MKIKLASIILIVLFGIPKVFCQDQNRQSVLGTYFSVRVPYGFTYHPAASAFLSGDSLCSLFFAERKTSRLSFIRNGDANNLKSKTKEIISVTHPKVAGMEALFVKAYYSDSVRRSYVRELTLSNDTLSLSIIGTCSLDHPEYLAKIDSCLLSLRLSARGEQFGNSGFAGYVRIPTTGTALVPPADFQLMKEFTGLRNEARSATIVVTEMPVDILRLQKGLTPDQMLAKGVKITRYEPMLLTRVNAMWMEGEQSDGNTLYKKLIYVFGDESRSSMLIGMYPMDADKEMYREMTKSLMSAIYAPFLQSEELVVDYTLSLPETDFVLHKNMLGAQMYRLKNSDDTATIFIASKSYKPIKVADRRQEAINRVKLLPHPEAIVIDSVSAVTIDSLEGYEVLARGKDNLGKPISIYSVMLFPEDGRYYILSGRTRQDRPMAIRLFRELAFSFRRI